MRSFVFASLVCSSIALLAQGCAAEAASTDDTSSDLTAHSTLSGASAEVLADVLAKANAPSTTPAGITGVSSHVARIMVTTAQGGIAHFISEAGSVSTVDGGRLGDLVDLGVAWASVRDALTAGGATFTTVAGDHGASSSTMFAKVACSEVVSPTARPSCTVSPIRLTEGDDDTLMDALDAAGAPSNTPAGITGVGSRIARVELTTAQGGIAHFVSEGGSFSTLGGTSLGALVDLGVGWKPLESALLDGGLSWTTKQGASGASSSTMKATIECTRVVSPTAKPRCSVTAE